MLKRRDRAPFTSFADPNATKYSFESLSISGIMDVKIWNREFWIFFEYANVSLHNNVFSIECIYLDKEGTTCTPISVELVASFDR